jgi:hypothetical protein
MPAVAAIVVPLRDVAIRQPELDEKEEATNISP